MILNSRETLSLDGNWSFALDPLDAGEREGWFRQSLDAEIRVPGSWEEQGFGDAPATHPLGGWSKRHTYEGAAWYSHLIEISPAWQGRIIELHLQGVRWRSQVWLGSVYVGEADSLSTAHIYDLTPFLVSETQQRLTIRVDNRMIYGLEESHANSEHTATRWGGITGGVEIRVLPAMRFGAITARTNVSARRFDFTLGVDGTATDLTVEVTLTNPDTGTMVSRHAQVHQNQAALSLELDTDARLWWDDDPFLYEATFTLRQGETILDTVHERIGLREISVDGKDLLLNGVPVFLRGYVDCCIFPLTGYPSRDVEDYRRQFRIAKSYGFNHVRAHSWTPPAPFWQAADEAGMLVQTELPNWARVYDLPEVEPPEALHGYLISEFERIIAALHLHPSWMLFSNGNELIGSGDGHPRLTELVERGRELDPTRLYTDNTGFGQLPAVNRPVDFYVQSCNWHPPKKIYDAATNDTTQDFSAITALTDRPLIGHEHGQFTMYARPEEAAKFTSVVQPAYLESVVETLNAKGMSGRIDQFIQASGTHSARTYKETLERARRTRDLAGVQLLDIRDFPGQGHATTGILDVFWDSKGLVEPETFAQSNGAIVLLMRAASPTFYNDSGISLDLEISNFGREAIPAGVLQWELHSRTTKALLSGSINMPQAPNGKLTALGRLQIALPVENQAQAWELTVTFGGARNSWHLWSYPYPKQVADEQGMSTRISTLRSALPNADFSDSYFGVAPTFTAGRRTYPDWKLAISDRLTGKLLQYLYDGGSVWLMPDGRQLHNALPTRYLPPFWSYLWFPENLSTIMGMIIHDHPALANFPHDGCSDWQWYNLVNDTPAINLDAVPFIEPIVEVVDNFTRANRLCYAFEARVGRGRLFVSTWRLADSAVAGRPEARYLLDEVTRYLQSDKFAPQQQLSVGQLLGMFRLANGLAGGLLE